MKNISLISLAILLLCTSCLSKTNSQLSTQNEINDYREQLTQRLGSGGSLVCENDKGGKTVKYNTCSSFTAHQEQGCYGQTTYEMTIERSYTIICKELQILNRANVAKTSFFDLESADWWKPIPAEVIPIRGGIYTEDKFEQLRSEHQELVKGNSLGDLDFKEMIASSKTFETYLSFAEYDCGSIGDHLNLQAVLLADLDDDGIAELIIQGNRANRSETCLLGTGNNLGSEFIAIVNKDSALETPSITSIPNTD